MFAGNSLCQLIDEVVVKRVSYLGV
jgi:hypothetical protein